MIEVEVIGAEPAPGMPQPGEIRELCARVAARLGVHDGHVAVEFVDGARIAALNVRHRGRDGSTDVLSFPIDGVEPLSGSVDADFAGAEPALPRELGDVVISPEHTVDVREAIVHGMLHLLGMDHEHDDGEMLALQDELLARAEP